MKKKGFTLIELLAVIVILAVIALIATPIILGMIENTKKEASKDSAMAYIDETLSYMSLSDYNDEAMLPDGTYNLIEKNQSYKAFNDYINLKGNKPTGGEITLKNSKVTAAKMCIGGYEISYSNEKYTVGSTCKSIVSPFDIKTTSTSSNIIVNTEVKNSENITKYYYSIDGKDYVESTENTHIFSKLSSNTKYTIYVKIENNYGEQETSSVEETTGNVDVPNFIIEPSGENWTTSKDITITYPTAPSGETFNYSYSIDGGNNWTPSTTTKTLTFTSPGNVIARVFDGKNYFTGSVYTIDKIDTTIPTTTLTINSTTTSKATVTAVCSDTESGITKYQFYLDGTIKQTYQTNSVSQNYTYTSLGNGNHTLKVVCTNNAEATNSNEIETLQQVVVPTYVVNPSGDIWATSKNITITYPTVEGEDLIYSYSIDNGNSWTTSPTTTKTLTLTTTGNVIARIYDGTTYFTGSTYKIDKIDTTIPTTNLTIDSTTTSKATVTAVCSDTESGTAEYQFYLDGTLKQTYQTNSVSQNYTYTSLSNGNHTLKVVCTNGVNLTNNKEISSTQTTVIPTYLTNPSGDVWAISKDITITFPTIEGEDLTYSYSIDGGTNWTTSPTTTKTLTFTTPGNVIARVYDGTNYFNGSVYNIDKIDITIPSTTLTLNSTTTSKATVTAVCSDTETGITKYQFYLDGVSKQTYTTSNTTQTHTYTSLSNGSHTLKVVCTNGINLTNNKEVSSTQTTVVPTYAISTTGWATNKNVTITYPTAPSGETFTYSYSTNGGTTWTTSATITKVVNFTASGNVIARVYDGTNYFTGSSYTIDKIDTTTPTITISSSLPSSLTRGDSYTILGTYTVGSSGGTTTCSSNINGTISNSSSLTAGTHTITCTVTNGAGVSVSTNKTVAVTYTAYTGKNLMTNSDFSTATTAGWYNAIASVEGGALKLNTPNSQAFLIYDLGTSIPSVAGHKLYVTAASSIRDYNAGAGLQVHSCQNNVSYCFANGPFNTIDWGWNPNAYNGTVVWKNITRYFTANYAYLEIMLCQSVGTSTTGLVYFDNILVLDLTATFGAGNEPSEAWCDSHISYFNGTTTIYK